MSAKVTLPLGWVSRDGKIIIPARGLRTFAQGFVAIVLAVYLAKLGLSLVEVGAFFSAGVAGGAVMALLVGLVAEKLGRRRLLIGLTLLTAAAATMLVLTDNTLVLTVLAFVGALSGVDGGGGAQPTLPLEQASLADAAAPWLGRPVFHSASRRSPSSSHWAGAGPGGASRAKNSRGGTASGAASAMREDRSYLIFRPVLRSERPPESQRPVSPARAQTSSSR